MGNPYPNHVCTISPFDSYNSNVVNRINRLVSNGENCILSSQKIDATIDSPTEVTLTAGSVFKDDVFIEIEDFTIDFDDADYYYHGIIWDEIGYYYIVLYYVYEKTRPAPRPRIQILKPSERGEYTPSGDFLLLKVAQVSCSVTFSVDALLNYDPENLSNKRIYSKTYLGFEDDQPIFNFSRDYGRILFTIDDNMLQYGTDTEWKMFPDADAIEAEIENLRLFVGADGPTDATPDYTSIRHIVQNSNLETAISKLDLSLGYSSLTKTISDNSATPSILFTDGKICGLLNISNSLPTTITNFIDAPSVSDNESITIILHFNNSNTTIQHNSNINLVNGINFSAVTGDALILLRHGGIWNEISRSVTGESGLFHIDHDSSGHHRLGDWHIGTGLVTSSATELNVLDGIGPSVTAPNLTKLTDGSTLGTGELHQHGVSSFIAQLPRWRKKLSYSTTPIYEMPSEFAGVTLIGSEISLGSIMVRYSDSLKHSYLYEMQVNNITAGVISILQNLEMADDDVYFYLNGTKFLEYLVYATRNEPVTWILPPGINLLQIVLADRYGTTVDLHLTGDIVNGTTLLFVQL